MAEAKASAAATKTTATATKAAESKAPDATTTPDAKTSEAKTPAKQPVLKVRSVPARFRRGGIEFTSEISTHKVSDLTKDQIEAIKAEKNLVVIEAEE